MRVLTHDEYMAMQDEPGGVIRLTARCCPAHAGHMPRVTWKTATQVASIDHDTLAWKHDNPLTDTVTGGVAYVTIRPHP